MELRNKPRACGLLLLVSPQDRFPRAKEKALSTPVGPGQLAARMGIQSGFLVLERGFGDDADETIRKEISQATGNELLDEDSQEVVDLVMSWWREEDGDLTDELVGWLTYLSERGPIWLFTPKVGRDGHVEPSDIQDAAQTAGLSLTSTIPASKDWTATRLVARKSGRK